MLFRSIIRARAIERDRRRVTRVPVCSTLLDLVAALRNGRRHAWTSSASLRRPSSDRDRDGRRVSVFSFASKERAPRSKQLVTAMRHGRGTETVADSHGNATNWRSASSSFSINLFRLERAYSPSLDSLPRPGTRYRLPRYSPARSKPTKRIRAPRADTVTRKGKDRDPRAVRLATWQSNDRSRNTSSRITSPAAVLASTFSFVSKTWLYALGLDTDERVFSRVSVARVALTRRVTQSHSSRTSRVISLVTRGIRLRTIFKGRAFESGLFDSLLAINRAM